MTSSSDLVFNRGFILIMAITCGVCAGANYFNQPIIYQIANSLAITVEQAAVTIVISQFAYALGLIVLIPLGDKFSKRKLVLGLMVISAIAQVGIGFTSQLCWLYVLTFIATTFSIASQVLIPFISSLASPEKMSQIIGTLMSGLLLGILLARAYAGLVSTYADWHTVYLTSGILLFFLTAILYVKLPIPKPNPPINILSVYQSMWQIAINNPHLIRRGLVGALAFGSVILGLSTMAFILANPPYSYSELAIGFFGLVGGAGVFATKWAGHQISLNKENFIAYLGGAALITHWVLLYFAKQSIVFYVFGLVLGYFAISLIHVLNQSLVLRHAGETRSRKHSIYMFMYFMGAALGSSAGLSAWAYWGWQGCCVMGLLFSVSMLIIDRLDYHLQKKAAFTSIKNQH